MQIAAVTPAFRYERYGWHRTAKGFVKLAFQKGVAHAQEDVPCHSLYVADDGVSRAAEAERGGAFAGSSSSTVRRHLLPQ